MRNNFINNKKSIYLLPNALTTAAMFCGFLSIIAASNGQYEKSVLSIIFAAIFDGLDGRVARLTKSQSVFGEVYDSLSDMVSFGVAPAMLTYFWLLQSFGQLGSAAVFIYMAGAAMRLARFTAKVDGGSSLYFTGLPSPAAGLCVASFVWVMVEYAVDIVWAQNLILPLTPLLGLLMVSNVEYYSFKKIPLRTKISFTALAAPILLIFALLLLEPVFSMLLVFWGYALLYLLYWCFKLLRRKPKTQGHLPPMHELEVEELETPVAANKVVDKAASKASGAKKKKPSQIKP